MSSGCNCTISIGESKEIGPDGVEVEAGIGSLLQQGSGNHGRTRSLAQHYIVIDTFIILYSSMPMRLL